MRTQILALTAAVFLTVSSVSAQDTSLPGALYKVQEHASLYVGPGAAFPIQGHLVEGETIKIRSCSAGWCTVGSLGNYLYIDADNVALAVVASQGLSNDVTSAPPNRPGNTVASLTHPYRPPALAIGAGSISIKMSREERRKELQKERTKYLVSTISEESPIGLPVGEDGIVPLPENSRVPNASKWVCKTSRPDEYRAPLVCTVEK